MAHKPRGKYQELPIEAVVHRQDRRSNIPTEELRDFVAEDEAMPKTILYPRDSSLDPQEFYQHEQNWANRMILGDSLLVMTSLAEILDCDLWTADERFFNSVKEQQPRVRWLRQYMGGG